MRIDEVEANFSADVEPANAYLPVFGAAIGKLDALRADKGGRVPHHRVEHP
ncbi:MAG TPA: hypothetical protein VIT92_10020 [Burkholderiaceae bacterium]